MPDDGFATFELLVQDDIRRSIRSQWRIPRSELDYRPGDVAEVECSDGEWRLATFEITTYGEGLWRFADGLYRVAVVSQSRSVASMPDPADHEALETWLAS